MVFYFIYTLSKNGDVFYVGITKNLNRRFTDHKLVYGKDIEINKVDEFYGDSENAALIERNWIKKFISYGCKLINKSIDLPNKETKSECLLCKKQIYSLHGKREKKFCNSTCRSKFWQKSQKNRKPIQQIVRDKGFFEKKEKAFVDMVVLGSAEVELAAKPTKNVISEEKPQNDMPEELVNQIIAIQTQPKPSFVPLKNFKSYKQKQIDELMKNYKKQ